MILIAIESIVDRWLAAPDRADHHKHGLENTLQGE